jgi:excisionase family DNA binding protein
MERNPLLDEAKTAEVLGVTKGTLQVWRSTKRYPLPYVKVGRSVRYRMSDIEAFLQQRTVSA